MASVIVPEVVKAKVAELIPYPNNPRVGNVQLIAESLKTNGQFRPLIVQKSTNYVLGGNHTLLGAKKLRWKTIDVCYVDVDDAHAAKIVLADNRTSDLATYDVEALTRIINSIEEPHVGTGYSASDITNLIASVAERDAEVVQEVISGASPRITFDDDDAGPQTLSERIDAQQAAIMGSTVLDPEARAMMQGEDVRYEGAVSDQQKIHVEIQTKVESLLGSWFTSSNYWGIADIRPDMLVDSLPDKLDTWAGQDTTPDDGETTWLLNWGSASSKGIPWNRTILGFYSHDHRWENWYESTAFLIGKVMSQGVTQFFQPENSVIMGFPRFTQLQSTYQSNWLTRIMQEAGMRVIPTLRICDMESIQLSTIGIPKNAPVMALGHQQKDRVADDDGRTGFPAVLRTAIKELTPQSLIVYGGPKVHQLVADAKLPKGLEVRYIENFSAKRNQALKPWHEQKKVHDNLVKEERKRQGLTEPEEPQLDEDE